MKLNSAEREFIVRIAKPFASCHASHLVPLPGGDVLVAWFAGSKEGADDIAIWGSRRHDGRWSEAFLLADEAGVPHWNPVFFRKEDGELWLFYKVGKLLREWQTRTIISRDDGFTWSDPAELVEGDRGGRGPVRNKVIVLSDGNWIAPASTENGIWKAFADISRDQGRTWEKSGDICIKGLDYDEIKGVSSDIPVSEQSFKGRGVIQPTLWESEPGKVHMLLRSSEGHIYRSDSEDSGRTWCDAYPTSLPNNNSGIDVVRLADGTLVLAFNPIGVNWGARTPLVLRVSQDNGLAWGEELVLEDEKGEFSYPVIVSDGSDLHMTYTWKRENIAYRRFVVER